MKVHFQVCRLYYTLGITLQPLTMSCDKSCVIFGSSLCIGNDCAETVPAVDGTLVVPRSSLGSIMAYL
jgi:hypothetical protein